MEGPKYPNVHVQIRSDSDPFVILGEVRLRMKEAGLPHDAPDRYTVEATSRDFPHLIETTEKFVDVAWVDADTPQAKGRKARKAAK